MTRHTTAADSAQYLMKLLRYLHDTEWAEQRDKRAFGAVVLQESTGANDEKNHPLFHVLEAVETIGRWWP